jgi:hypothetical protein
MFERRNRGEEIGLKKVKVEILSPIVDRPSFVIYTVLEQVFFNIITGQRSWHEKAIG